MHEGLFIITAVQVSLSRGSTVALEARGDLYSWATGTMKKLQTSDCLFATAMAGEVPILTHFCSLRAGQEVAS
jgi:hypothetical protein